MVIFRSFAYFFWREHMGLFEKMSYIHSQVNPQVLSSSRGESGGVVDSIFVIWFMIMINSG